MMPQRDNREGDQPSENIIKFQNGNPDFRDHMINKMADDRSGLLGTGTEQNAPPPATDDAIYGQQNVRTKYLQLAFVAVVAGMVLLSVILSISSGAKHGVTGAFYFMLGISLVGFVAIEVFLVLFLRKGDLPASKAWFLYFIGGCIILEAIFTDVLVTQP